MLASAARSPEGTLECFRAGRRQDPMTGGIRGFIDLLHTYIWVDRSMGVGWMGFRSMRGRGAESEKLRSVVTCCPDRPFTMWQTPRRSYFLGLRVVSFFSAVVVFEIEAEAYPLELAVFEAVQDG